MSKYVCIDNGNHKWKHLRESDPKLLELHKVYNVEDIISDIMGMKFYILDDGNYLSTRFITLNEYRTSKIELLIE